MKQVSDGHRPSENCYSEFTLPKKTEQGTASQSRSILQLYCGDVGLLASAAGGHIEDHSYGQHGATHHILVGYADPHQVHTAG
jgi:hypothetical protein